MTTLPHMFEILCRGLFGELGYSVLSESDVEWGADIFAEGKDERLLAEVRWTHRSMVYYRLLRDWVPMAAKLMAPESAKVVLVVSGTVDEESRGWAESGYGIRIWDRGNILEKAPNDRIRDAFERFFALSDAYPLSGGTQNILENRAAVEKFIAEADLGTWAVSRGRKLIGRLNTTPAGREAARQYEELCVDMISYLFGDVLVDGEPQLYTESELDRFDVVYRVSPNANNAIWDALVRDFRARVIVFECKNYSEAFGPMQVYTTERYLSVRALRTVCFMVTREEPNAHAYSAAQAAMRQAGKLMIFLTNDDFTKMLRRRDAQLKHEPGSEGWKGMDPAIHLDEKIYKMLATMPR